MKAVADTVPDGANMLRIRTFGGLSIKRDGETIETFASRKAEALLVYLACNIRPRPREVLAELLWDDRSQRQAMANLRVVLSSLRKEVGGYAEITRTTASIAADAALRLDVVDLEAAATRLREQDGHFSSDVVEEMVAALAGYEGDFLEGFFIPDASGFEAWASTERERLHRLAQEALQGLGQWHLAQADYAEAIATSSRLLELDPLSEVAHRQLMEALARNGQRSQALAVYEAFVQRLRRELGIEPSGATQELVEAIQDDSLETAIGAVTIAQRTRYRLPASVTPLVGRERELGEIREILARGNSRVVSIVAPGGMGKTRLALEVAHTLAEDFGDGAAFVSLASQYGAVGLVPAVAQALRFDFDRDSGPDAKRQLLDHLRGKELLLVLDNFEHLLDAVSLLSEIVHEAPGVRILVTSRERLRLHVEQVYPLHGFPLRQWNKVTEAQDDPAVQFFLYHARRVRPSFTLNAEHLQPLQEILRLVGGMPLAMILAAGWVSVLSPAQIAGEIGRSLDLLKANERDLPQRHRSMRAVWGVMWQRLSGPEQENFAALSVFRGGFTLEAAREVAGATPRDLLKLVDRSLLTRLEGGRFEVHELLRQFAAERLALSQAEEKTIAEQHSRYYCKFLHQRELDLKGPRYETAIAEIDAEIDNVRLAWKWATTNRRVRLLQQATFTLCHFLDRPLWWAEAGSLCGLATKTLEGVTEPAALRLRALLLAWRGRFAQERDLVEFAARLLEESLSVLENEALAIEDVRPEKAYALMVLGSADKYSESEYGADRERRLQESLALYRELGDEWMAAQVLVQLSVLATDSVDYKRAGQLLQEALAIFQSLDDPRGIADTLRRQAGNAPLQGRFEEAVRLARKYLTFQRSLGDPNHLATGLYHAGITLIWAGEYAEGARLLEQSLPVQKQRGPRMVGFIYGWLGYALCHQGQYKQAIYEIERGLAVAREYKSGPAIIHWYYGQTLLALETYVEAEEQFSKAIRQFRRFDEPNEMGLAFGSLGHVRYQTGDTNQARRYLREALQIAVKVRAFMPLYAALPVASLLLADHGEEERAIELYSLLSRYPPVAKSQWFYDMAGRKLEPVAAALSPDVAASARERGRKRDLWDTAEELLQELKNVDP